MTNSDHSVDSIYGYWGKTASDGNYHLLPYHCLDVAAVLTALIKRDKRIRLRLADAARCDLKALLPWLAFFAAIHDFGKFSPIFQEKSPEVLALLGKPLCGSRRGHHHPRSPHAWG